MRTDVLVIGAGPAGSSSAYFLAKAGLDVILCDKETFPRDKICGGGITRLGVSILEDMGIMNSVYELKSTRPYQGMRFHVSNGHPFEIKSVSQNKLPLSNGGIVVHRMEFDELLMEYAVANGAKFLPRYHVIGMKQETDDSVYVKGTIGNQRVVDIRAKMVVVATGANSKILQTLGLYKGRNVTSVAMRGYFQMDNLLDPFLEFYLNDELIPGYGWVFPLAHGYANIGIGHSGGNSISRIAFSNFIETLRKTSSKLKNIKPIEKEVGFPLFSDISRQMSISPNILVAGEAAGLVDPLLGEGISFALSNSRIVAKIIYATIANGDYSLKKILSYRQHLWKTYEQYFAYTSLLRIKLRGSDKWNALFELLRRYPTLYKFDTITTGSTFSKELALINLILKSIVPLGNIPYLAFRAKTLRDNIYEEEKNLSVFLNQI